MTGVWSAVSLQRYVCDIYVEWKEILGLGRLWHPGMILLSYNTAVVIVSLRDASDFMERFFGLVSDNAAQCLMFITLWEDSFALAQR